MNIDRTMKGDFEDSKCSRLGQKLADWKPRALSATGIIVFIKSNLIGIPQYSMNRFKITKYI